MAKQIDIVCADNTRRQVTGQTMLLPLGNRMLRAFVHGETLSHYASGYRICDLRPYMILNYRSNRRRDKRADAMLALRDLTEKIGIEKAWRIIDSAPVINN